MKEGLYEKVLDNKSKQELKEKEYLDVRNIDKSELSNVISIAYQKIIREQGYMQKHIILNGILVLVLLIYAPQTYQILHC